MAASLDIKREDCLHYYHCVLYDIPFDLPVSAIASHLTPQELSTVVQELKTHSAHIVPHQLHVYKEPLSAKFGYYSFFVNLDAKAKVGSGEVHSLVLRWIEDELAPQLLLVKTKVKLAQPPECHSSENFLREFNLRCAIVHPAKVLDTRKMETFILSKLTFNKKGRNAHSNVRRPSAPDANGSGDGGERLEEREEAEPAEEEEWHVVGTASLADLKPNELLWLKKQHQGFPPVLITNQNVNTAHCDTGKLEAFLKESLSPLFEVTP